MADEEFAQLAEDYKISLKEDLTFNCKGTINTLTTIAGENIQAAQIITKVIENRIHTAGPQYKLPALYLLDSICKNVGAPYSLLFGINLYKTFTETYTLVSDSVRAEMQKLYLTWTIPGSNGQTLFQPQVLKKLEAFLTRALQKMIELKKKENESQEMDKNIYLKKNTKNLTSNPNLASSSSSSSSSTRSGYNNSQKSQKQSNDLRYNLTNSSSSIPVPSSSYTSSNSGNSSDVDIRQNDLNAFNPLNGFPMPPVPPPPPQQLLPHQQLQQTQIPPYPNLNPAVQYPPATPFPVQLPLYSPMIPQPVPPPASNSFFEALKTLGVLTGGAQGIVPPPPPNAFMQQPQFNQQLPGFVPQNDKTANFNTSTDSKPINLYNVDLTSSSLHTPRYDLSRNLYENLPIQCNFCGKRFKKDDESLIKLHLDWHIRITTRLKEGGYLHSRAWLITEEEWIDLKDLDESLIDANDIYSNDMASKKNETEDLTTKYILAPTNPTSDHCPICKEKFIPEWQENLEEWVWYNAVEMKKKVYHATCYHEALKDNSNNKGSSNKKDTKNNNLDTFGSSFDFFSLLSNSKRKLNGDDNSNRVKKEKLK